MSSMQRRAGLVGVLVAGGLVGALTPVRVYPDSIGYIGSAVSFFSAGFADEYAWLREPLYPMFLRLMLELPPAVALHAIPVVQGVSLALGLWLLAATARGLGLLDREALATCYGLTCLLLSGYSGAVLQQTSMILAAGALAYCAMRLATGPVSRGFLAGSAAVAASSVLLSSIFLPSVALLPLATVMVDRRRFRWQPFVAVWGSAALAMGLWMVVRVASGQAFGLGGATVLDRSNTTDLPLRIHAFLATFGLAPDYYDGVNFNVLSYSNVALGINPYFGSSPCVDSALVDLTTMPDAYLMCGSTLAGNLPPSLLQPITTYALLQGLIGVIALIWAWSATSSVRLYALVLVITLIPCLPVAVFLADGNSRYGLPVLALSLVLTVGMVSGARGRLRQRPVQRPDAGSEERGDAAQTLRPTQRTD